MILRKLLLAWLVISVVLMIAGCTGSVASYDNRPTLATVWVSAEDVNKADVLVYCPHCAGWLCTIEQNPPYHDPGWRFCAACAKCSTCKNWVSVRRGP